MNKVILKKGEIVQSSGELNTKIYHVESGLLRSYSIDKKGREHIFMFAPEDWIMGDNTPPEEPSVLFIQAIEKSVVYIFDKIIENEKDSRKLIKRLAVLQKRIVQLLSASAIERYEDFISTYPNLSQRISQKMIASYLGITPEALSKIKGERISK